MTLFPVVHELGAGARHPGRDLLFASVGRFDFVDRRHGRLRIDVLPLGSVTVARVRSTGHDIALHEGARMSLLVPFAGQVGIETERTRFDAQGGGAISVGSGHRRTFVRAPVGRHFDAAVVLYPEPPRRRGSTVPPGRAYPAAAMPAELGSLLRYCRFLIEEFENPQTWMSRPGALRASEALILDLLAAIAVDDVHEGTGNALPLAARIRMAEEIMRARSDEPLTIAALARETGVGVRALQLAFRAHRGLAPRTLLARFRLDRARERLISAGPAQSVTAIAIDCGFSHLGRFAAAYRARFGEAPSTTLRRAGRRA
jgi:AraC-like DNA-binding protein